MSVLFLVCYNFIRMFFVRIRNYESRLSWVQRISPFCRLKVSRYGRLNLDYNIQIEAGSDIQVHENGVLHIGSRTYMNRYCMISVQNAVSIGDNCMFGPGVKIFDNNHCFSAQSGVSSELKTAPISIGNNCWIVSDVVLLKGTVVGNNCVIGAGCVISGNIPDGTLVTQKKELQLKKIIDRV